MSRPVLRGAIAGIIGVTFFIWGEPALAHRLAVGGLSGTAARLGGHLAFYALCALCVLGLHRATRSLHGGTHRAAAAAWLLALAVLVRGPFWFPPLLDADEGGLIVMGQDLVDGHLPFTGIWDVKPPGAIAAVAAIVAFGRSIVPLRVAGTLLLAASALLLASAGSRRDRLWAPVLLIVFVSAAVGGQATLTEHLALLPLTGLLAVAQRDRYRVADAALIGLLLGIAMLFRTNLAVAAAGGIAAIAWRSPAGARAANSSAFAIAAALPTIALAVVYLANGQLDAFVHGVFVVPFLLPHVGGGALPEAIANLGTIIARHAARDALLFWVAAAGGAISAIRSRPHLQDDDRAAIVWLGLVLLSILAMSAAFEHYLILAMPFAAYLGGAWLDRLTRRPDGGWAVAAIAAGLIVPLMGTPGRYVDLWQQLQGTAVDDGRALVAYLRESGAAGRYVYTLDDSNAAAWLAAARHASRFVDPGQLREPALISGFAGPGATMTSELLRAFDRQPLFVVITREDGVDPAIDVVLQRSYRPVASFGLHIVYRLADPLLLP